MCSCSGGGDGGGGGGSTVVVKWCWWWCGAWQGKESEIVILVVLEQGSHYNWPIKGFSQHGEVNKRVRCCAYISNFLYVSLYEGVWQ